MKRIFIAIIVTTLFSVTSGSAWHLYECNSSESANRQRYVEKLRKAQPRDLDYVPKPFPRSNAHIVEDFFYQFRFLRSVQKPRDITPEDRLILSLMDATQLGVEVVRIANWCTTRCLGAREGETKFLLRLRDKRDGREIGRAWLVDSGLLGATALREQGVAPAFWDTPFPDLQDSMTRVSGIVGQLLVDAQYVTTFGQFACDALLPCVAMRSPASGTVFITSARGEIVALPTNARRFSRARDLETPRDIDNAARSLQSGQKLMSLGGDVFVAVETVP